MALRKSACATALICGYFAACTVAEIQQCWIPMSRQLQAVKAGALWSTEQLAAIRETTYFPRPFEHHHGPLR